MRVLVTCKYKKDRMKSNRGKGERTIFPIISQWGLSVAMDTRVLIQSASKVVYHAGDSGSIPYLGKILLVSFFFFFLFFNFAFCNVTRVHSVPPQVLLLQYCVHKDMWAASWQNQLNGMCAQRRLRSAWASASAQSDQSLRCPHEESLGH